MRSMIFLIITVSIFLLNSCGTNIKPNTTLTDYKDASMEMFRIMSLNFDGEMPDEEFKLLADSLKFRLEWLKTQLSEQEKAEAKRHNDSLYNALIDDKTNSKDQIDKSNDARGISTGKVSN